MSTYGPCPCHIRGGLDSELFCGRCGGFSWLVAAPRYRLGEASERWPSTTLTLQLVGIYNFAEETKAVGLTVGEFVVSRTRSWSSGEMTAFFHTTTSCRQQRLSCSCYCGPIASTFSLIGRKLRPGEGFDCGLA